MNYKSAFKLAAPNLAEAEGAEILDPEWSHSIEGRPQLRAFERASLNFSIFQMDLENMVVSILGPGGTPALTNAGHERFRATRSTSAGLPLSFPRRGSRPATRTTTRGFVRVHLPEGRDDADRRQRQSSRAGARGKWSTPSSSTPRSTRVGGFVTIRYQGERFQPAQHLHHRRLHRVGRRRARSTWAARCSW